MKKIIFFIVACTLSFFPLHSQGKGDLKEVFSNGVFFYEYGEYKEALFNFMQVYMADTANANINYKIAMCYLSIPGWESKSLPFFERATKNIEGSYKDFSYTWKSAPLHTLFYLGQAYRKNNDLEKAMEVINQFISSPYYMEYNPKIVDEEIATIKRATILKDKPVQFELRNFGETINTKSDNYRAVISADGLTMVYISKQKLYDAIFITKRFSLSDPWKKPLNISFMLGSDGNLFPCALSSDGKKLLLVRNQSDGNGDIYISSVDSIEWSKAVLIPGSINSSSNETHASFSEDGKSIYFASDKKSIGGLDLFVSTMQPDGLWSAGKSLGKKINTKFNENYPVVLDHGKTIYFSSEGHYNMGNYDIFASHLSESGEWGIPENLGYPINSTVDDVFFIPFNEGLGALMHLNRPDGFGDLDIYEYSMEKVTH